MNLAIVVDMNLSPDWVPLLCDHGWPASHWSTIGDPRAPDFEIMAWARANQHVVFTHDLDFGTMLALTGAVGPSVLQVRAQNVLPDHMGPLVIAALR
jgi:predicted nuclease of predicted toxin-antitoxin system